MRELCTILCSFRRTAMDCARDRVGREINHRMRKHTFFAVVWATRSNEIRGSLTTCVDGETWVTGDSYWHACRGSTGTRVVVLPTQRRPVGARAIRSQRRGTRFHVRNR